MSLDAILAYLPMPLFVACLLLLYGQVHQVVAVLHANYVNRKLTHEFELNVSKYLVTGPGTELPHKSVVPAPLEALCDFVLGAVRNKMVNNHSTVVPVPNFKKEFLVPLGPLKVQSHLETWGGSAGDFSSLIRVGPVNMFRQSNGNLFLNIVFGLKTLRVRYSRYTARAGPIHVSGSLEAETSPATLRAVLLFQSPGAVRLNELQLAELGPLRVRVTGLDVLQPLLPFLEKWRDERMCNDVQKVVIEHLSDVISQHLTNFSF